MSLPMPCAAPVTSAILPFKFISFFGLFRGVLLSGDDDLTGRGAICRADYTIFRRAEASIFLGNGFCSACGLGRSIAGK
jgi:hypothetical protein